MTDLMSHVAAIDFLPSSYREQTAKRRTHLWRGAVIAVFAVILGTSGYFQYQMYEAAKLDLVAVEPAYARAQQATHELAEVQAKLMAAERQAELLTYLRHPWLRSELLTAIVEPLPPALTLNTLNLSYQRGQASAAPVPAASDSQAAVNNTPPEVRDLKQLRGEVDEAQLEVILTGQASETALLHQYLATLAGNRLLAEVELKSIEAESDKASRGAQFTIRLLVREGYGQPQGPSPTAEVAESVPARPQAGV